MSVYQESECNVCPVRCRAGVFSGSAHAGKTCPAGREDHDWRKTGEPEERKGTDIAVDELRKSILAPGAAGVYDEHDVAICPDVRAAGHNPHRLTVAQVGAGWRLLAKEEIIAERRLHGGDRYAIEAWIGGGWDATGWAGNEAMYTYRTKQPPGYYAPFESEVRKIAKKRGPGTWEDIAEACCRAAEVVAVEKVRKKLAELPATDAEAKCPVVPTCPPPVGTKYVHTFVCHACPRTCTMETETMAPGPLVPGSFDMQCPFRRPAFIALWVAGPVHTLTP